MLKQKLPRVFLFIIIPFLLGLFLALNLNYDFQKSSSISLHIVLLMLTMFIWNVAIIRYYSIKKKFDLILGYAYIGVFVLAAIELIGYALSNNQLANWSDMLQRLWLAFGLILLFPKNKIGGKLITQIKNNKVIIYLIVVAVLAVLGGILSNNIKHDTHSEIIELLNFIILIVLFVAFLQIYRTKNINYENLYSKILYSVLLIILAQTVYTVSLDDTSSITYMYAEFIEIISFSILAFGLLINIIDAFKYQQRARLVLINRNKQLEIIDKQKDEFVGFVSHQLRTPLTAIKWRIDLIEEKPDLDNQLRQDLDAVQVSNQHLINLVKMFLSVTRLNLNKYEPQIEFFSLKQVLDNILKDNDPAIVIKDLHIKTDCPDNIKISHDKTAVSSILDNLITNAIKYCRQSGNIQIKCSKHQGQLIMSVSDNGIGIPKNQQSNVFKPFVRLDNAKKTSASGSGYGLYFIQRLVTALGGIITFESVEDQGTVFEVKLPIQLSTNSEAVK